MVHLQIRKSVKDGVMVSYYILSGGSNENLLGVDIMVSFSGTSEVEIRISMGGACHGFWSICCYVFTR